MADLSGREVARVFEDASGEWRWHLREGNQEPICGSMEGYEDPEHAVKMMGRILGGEYAVLVEGIAPDSGAVRWPEVKTSDSGEKAFEFRAPSN